MMGHIWAMSQRSRLSNLRLLSVVCKRAPARHAVIAGTAHEKGYIGTRDQCFGRRASGVHARAAEMLSFNDGNLLTGSDRSSPRRQFGGGKPCTANACWLMI
jgi:hypothetical protein